MHTLIFTDEQLALLRGFLNAAMDGSDRCADDVSDFLDEVMPIAEELADDDDAVDAHSEKQWEALDAVLAIINK